MSTVRDTRRKNLEALLAKEDSDADFARALEVEPSYISQLVRGKRGIGHKTARKIERAKGMPEGWLDQAHELQSAEANNGKQDIPGLAVAWERLTPLQRAYYRDAIFRDAAINSVMPWFPAMKPTSPTYDAFEREVERDFSVQVQQLGLFDRR